MLQACGNGTDTEQSMTLFAILFDMCPVITIDGQWLTLAAWLYVATLLVSQLCRSYTYIANTDLFVFVCSCFFLIRLLLLVSLLSFFIFARLFCLCLCLFAVFCSVFGAGAEPL